MKRHVHVNERRTKKTQKYGPELELYGYSKKLIGGESLGKFQCNLCGKISNKRNDAFKHVESVHFPNTYQYDCDKCGEKFGTKNRLSKHRLHAHSSKKHNKEKPQKPPNYEKLQTIVKLGLHLVMEKNGVQQTSSASDVDGDDVEVIWSDYSDTAQLG